MHPSRLWIGACSANSTARRATAHSEIFDWRATSSTTRRLRSRVAKSLWAWMPDGSSRRMASILLTPSTILGYSTSESWRKLPMVLVISIRSFASAACSRRMISPERVLVLFFMQSFAEPRDKVGRQFGVVPIQFGDDAIKLLGAAIGGVQKPIGPKVSKFPLMLAQACQLRQPP